MCELFIKKFVEKCLEIHKPNHYELMYFDSLRRSKHAYQPHSLGSFDCYYNNMPEKMWEAEIDFFFSGILLNILKFIYFTDDGNPKKRKLSDNEKIVFTFFEAFSNDIDFVEALEEEKNESIKILIHTYLLVWLKEIHETVGLIEFFKGQEILNGQIFLMEDNSRFWETYNHFFNL